MTPQQILSTLTNALRNADFVVHDNDDDLTPSPFPGDAIAYIYRDQVELYLVKGSLHDGLKPDMAADRAAAAIDAAGLNAGPDPASALLTGRVVVTAS
ncbi:hypothetical protein [Nonomuraea sp. NPDC048826]|uniref:hypothetical protein n=1 Tax=Nonomuraea sp. NPDC048826 TaxID=3364347 RepID=UPI0037139298